MMTLTRMMIASAAAAVIAGAAQADLTGTSMDLSIVQSGTIGSVVGPSGGPYTYSLPSTYTIGSKSWTATSPALAPGFTNAILLDFTSFQYVAFTALNPTATSTLSISSIDENVAAGSVQVLLNGSNIALSAVGGGSGLSATWSIATVVAANPVNPQVTIAWNSVPAPGSLALLGAAGLISRRRRRRA